MKNKAVRKHLLSLLVLSLVIVSIFGMASAAILKSSMSFTNVAVSATKTSTFDVGYNVTLDGRATNGGSSASRWYMKFDGRSSDNLPVDGVTRSFVTSVTKASNNYGAYNLYPDSGFISGLISCYQH